MFLCPPPTILSGATSPPVVLSGAQTLLRSLGDTYGLGIDFATDQSMEIVDAGTPANNYSSTPYGKLTYTAPSDKWVLNASGVLAKITAGTALPYEYNTSAVCQGVLVEEQRTNLLLQSNTFGTTWTPERLTGVSTMTTGPDGVANSATLINEDTASGRHSVYQVITKATSALPYVLTVYAKQGVGRTRVALEASDNATGGCVAVFDLAGGQIGVAATGTFTPFTSLSSSLTSVGNGWYRCAMFFTSSTGNQLLSVVANDDGVGTSALSESFAGTIGNGVYIYQAQLEQAAYVSSPLGGSPVFTTTGTVTRAADYLTLATTAFPYSSSTQTMYLGVGAGTRGSDATLQWLAAICSGGYAQRLIEIHPASAGFVQGEAGGNSGSSVGVAISSAAYKCAVAAAANDLAFVVDGGAPSTDATVTMGQTPTTLSIGNIISTLPYSGYIAKIALWPRRISNAELQTVTT